MTVLSELGADKGFCILADSRFTVIGWIHNDSMYVRFGGMRNTETWSKSSGRYVMKAEWLQIKYRIRCVEDTIF